MHEWKKLGQVFSPIENKPIHPNWETHTMAPSAVFLKDRIRVYVGGWDASGISRIFYIDVNPNNPLEVLSVSENPVLDIGEDGCFDENGVFPAHCCEIDGKYFLYYTGFQLGHKIRHYNFGGLAISYNGVNFTRVSKAPILDRADEGLFVRAGQSAIKTDEELFNVYSAGNGWLEVNGKERPIYHVFAKKTDAPEEKFERGELIIECDMNEEHGLGRPQIYKVFDRYCIFYTRRTLDFRYGWGYSESSDLKSWKRIDPVIEFGNAGEFDEEMVYFPSVVFNPVTNNYLLFYCGNNFGETGLGVYELGNK